MKALTRLLLPTLAALLLAGSAEEARACSCVPERPVCEAFGGSSAVFVGRVVGSAQRKVSESGDGKKTTYDVGSIHFEVEESFGGVSGRKRVTIHSGTGGGDCGYWFLRGRHYLVYAGEHEGKFYTNICTRTRPLEEAAEDLAFLRDLPPAGTGVRLYGMVARPPYTRPRPEEAKVEGLPGVRVVVRGPGGSRRELFTDAEGRYEVANLRPGRYRVSAELPAQYYKGEGGEDEEVEIADRGCADVSFAAIPNGVVTGRVVSAEGVPVKKAEVVLLRAEAAGLLTMNDEVGGDEVEGEDGRFEIGQVPPGEYVLGVNLTWAPKAASPYPPTYYPGVTERAEATVLKVGLGERVPELLLRLPPPLAERRVSGVVVWPDGTPAAGAEVYLADVTHPGFTATGWGNKTDEQGRFTLTGFDGTTYWVHANGPRFPSKPYNESGMMHAEPPRVTLTSDAYGLRLVLASEGALCEHYLNKK